MKRLSNELWRHIADYLSGESTPEGREALVRWLGDDPEHHLFLARLTAGWSQIEKLPETAESINAVKASVAQQTGLAELDAIDPVLNSHVQQRSGNRIRQGEVTGLRRQTLRGRSWSVGATIAAMLAVLLFSYRVSARPETTKTYTTSPGQQATFTLSDGTHVTLAPRTTLRLIRFGSSSRAVILDGQAYFEVPHAAGAPFLVRTGTIATQVLGTAFLVRYYTNEGSVHIAVAEGKVRIAREASTQGPVPSPLTLTSGHAGDVTDSTVQMSTVDLAPETDWLRGRLVFRHTPVVDVLQKLSQWYGYQFRCNDSTLTNVRVTLALSARSSAEALSTLEQILSVQLTIIGDTVTLTPRVTQTQKGMVRKQMYDVWIPTREVGR